ncbi:MAG: heme exporter protein CcmD [Pseudomonadota bacterium]
MSGYGAFVWLSYYLGFVVVVWNLLNANRRIQSATQSAQRYAARHGELIA